MKKLKWFAVLACLLLVLAACNDDSDSSNGSDSDSGSSKKDEVTVWTFPHYAGNEELGKNSYEQDLQEMIAKYEEQNPNVEVKYEILSWAEGGKKFSTALNAGSPPDVYFSTLNEQFIQTGLAVPLDEYLTEEDLNDIAEYGKRVYTYDDKIWGIPHYLSLHTWGGNRELLEAAGADIEKIQNEGWTWDEFYEIAKAATKDGVYGFSTQGQTEETFTHLMINNGVRNNTEADGTVNVSGEKALESLQFLQKLKDEGIMPSEVGGFDLAKNDELFNSWQVAIYGRVGPYRIGEVAALNADIEAGKVDGKPIDIVLLPFPHNEGEKEEGVGGAGGLMLFTQKGQKDEQHTKNAADVLKWLTNAESGITAAAMNLPPARYSGQELYKEMIGFDTPNGQFMSRYLTTLTPPVRLQGDLIDKNSTFKADTLLPKFQAFITGTATPEETIEAWRKGAKAAGLNPVDK